MMDYSKEKMIVASEMLRVLGDTGRLRILVFIKDREYSVQEICEFMEMEQSAVSHQLRVLKKARLVKVRRDGRQRLYSLDDDHVLQILETVFEHLEEEDYERVED